MIIVTGAAGFIGSAIIWRLNKQGRKDIIAVDEENLSPHQKANIKNISFQDYVPKLKFIKKINKESYNQKLQAIIHLGACSDTTQTNEKYLTENNFNYTKILCNFSLDNKTRFIYASSAATYGDGSGGYADDETAIETLKPLNLYGESKHKFDLWAKQKDILSKIAGLKYFNVFGPNEYHKGQMRSMILKGFEQIKKTGKIKLFKSYKTEYAHGEQKRDFLYVKDAVEMTLFFLDNPGVNGIYNIGTGVARSWNDLANSIFKALGKPGEIEYIEMPEILKNKYQYFTQANIAKLRKAGYNKKITSLEEAVQDYVCNYLLSQRYLS